MLEPSSVPKTVGTRFKSHVFHGSGLPIHSSTRLFHGSGMLFHGSALLLCSLICVSVAETDLLPVPSRAGDLLQNFLGGRQKGGPGGVSGVGPF